MGNKTSALLGFVMGAATGAIFGILYAPDKGSNTRDKLSFLLDKYKADLEEVINKMIESENAPPSQAREKGNKVISDARQKAEKLLEDVDELIVQIKGNKE